MQCVILAGGRGTRMPAFTATIPKSLIPVNGVPFIDHQLNHLARTGVTNVVLSVGYKGAQIQKHVGNGVAWRLNVRYVDEGETLRGTGGALRLALDEGVLEPDFLMTYGDAYLPIDFSKVWRAFEERTEPFLMTIFKNDHRWGASNAQFDGEKVTRYDKAAGQRGDPSLQFLDYGVCGIRRSAIASDVTDTPCDLSDILKARSLRGDVAGLEVTTRFYEVGSPEGLKDLSDYLSTKGAV